MAIKNTRTAAMIGLALCMFVTSLGWMMFRVPEVFIQIEIGGGKAAWILSAYIIAEVAVLPIAGKLIDNHGPRNILAIGAVLFILSALVCSFVTSIDQMVVVRAFQGIGAGMVFSVVLSSVGLLYSGEGIGKPHELMTAAFAFGSLYGTMIGFWIEMELDDWRYAYYLCAALMVVGAAVAYRFLPRTECKPTHDRVGAVLLTVLIADLMFFSQLVNDEIELLSHESLALILVAVFSILVLYLAETHADDPMIPRSISRTQVGCMLCMFLAGFCGLGMVQFLMKFMLIGMNMGIYEASLMFLFLLGGGAITSMSGLKMMHRTGIRPWALAGPAIVLVGFVFASQTLVLGLPFVAASLFILGLGLGCIVTEMLCQVQLESRREHMGTITSLTMASRFVGILIGAAVFSAVVENALMAELRHVIVDNPSLTIEWIITHFEDFSLDLIQVFESSIEFCCLAAGVLSISILVTVYFLVERE